MQPLIALRDCSEQVREEPGCRRGFFANKQTKKQVRTSKDCCELKKTHNLELMNLVLFHVWGRFQVWAQWNHFFNVHLNFLLASILFCAPESLRACRQGQPQWPEVHNILCGLICHSPQGIPEGKRARGPQNRGERSEQVRAATGRRGPP